MYNTLLKLFPNFQSGDWILQDDSDGNGPYIKEWNRPEPQPTSEELALAAASLVETPEQIQARELAEQLARAKQVIEQERDALLDAGVVVGDYRYQTSAAFRLEITAILAAYSEGLLPPDLPTEIRTFDNQNVLLTRDEIRMVAGYILAHCKAVYKDSWNKKDALNVASPEE